MDAYESSNEGTALRRYLPLLLLFFVASGCAALIYEVVWFHLLRQVIGASAASLAIVLTSYMGGMCLGSLAFPRLISPRFPPLRVYAYLEAGIAVFGALLLILLPLVGKLYVAAVGYGQPGIALRALVSLFCLLPPTMLMGATLPAIARCVKTTRSGMSQLGLFYMANLAGGAIGCLLAGFYLLRVYDIFVASFVAVLLNVSVALASLAIASRADFRASDPASRSSRVANGVASANSSSSNAISSRADATGMSRSPSTDTSKVSSSEPSVFRQRLNSRTISAGSRVCSRTLMQQMKSKLSSA